MVALNIATKSFIDLDCSIYKEGEVANRQLTEILRYQDRNRQLIVEHKKKRCFLLAKAKNMSYYPV